MQTLFGVYTVATLPLASTVLPGTIALTSDGGPYYSTSSIGSVFKSDTWNAFASGSASTITVSASMAATQDNYAPAGYVAGTTNRLLLTPLSGGSTVNGLLAATDGFSMLVVNASATDSITFNHRNSSTPANRFSNANSAAVALPPLGASRVAYVTNEWRFY